MPPQMMPVMAKPRPFIAPRRRIWRTPAQPNPIAPIPSSTASTQKAPLTRPPQPPSAPISPKHQTTPETSREPIPAAIEPTATPDVVGGAGRIANPYGTSGNTSMRDGCG